MKLHFTNDWLRRTTTSDPDADVEAGALMVKLYDGVQHAMNWKLHLALKYLGTKWCLHPQYDGKHRYSDANSVSRRCLPQ